MINLTPLYIVGAGLARSVAGWFKNSIADGKITDFEWRQLGETVVRVGVIGVVVAYFPGTEFSMFESAIVAIGGDLVLQAVKKVKAKK